MLSNFFLDPIMLFFDKTNMLSMSSPFEEVHSGAFVEIENSASVQVEIEFAWGERMVLLYGMRLVHV